MKNLDQGTLCWHVFTDFPGHCHQESFYRKCGGIDMAYIEVENLKIPLPNTKKLALDGLQFQIEKGSFVGIVGENGAGKSTLCQAFSGLVPQFFKGAYGGKVMIGNQDAAKTPVSGLCWTVGLVFQNPFNQLSGAKETVFEEIAFGLQNFGGSQRGNDPPGSGSDGTSGHQ